MEIQLEIFGFMGGVLGIRKSMFCKSANNPSTIGTIGIPIGQLESQLSIKCENISPFKETTSIY